MDLKYVLHYLAGLLLAYAYDDLSNKRVASQLHTFPGTVYEAGNAVDKNTETCMRTLDVGFSSPYKTVWWKVDLGGMYSIYSINVLFKNYDGLEEKRQRGYFAGFSLFVSTTGDIQGSTLCFKDGPRLPPLNFTTTCTKHGRYVIFYNERLDGVTYPVEYETSSVKTELCEVRVLGCRIPDVYGSNCDNLCPINCKNNKCHIQHGSCFGCQPGWTGLYCNIICREGLYGVNCRHQCVGHCRDNTTCNHVTGQCERGCEVGWKGTLCEKVCLTMDIIQGRIQEFRMGWGRLEAICVDGTYGYDCVNNCSDQCLNNSPCNKQTGHCHRGCNPGHTDSKCSQGSLQRVDAQTEPSCTFWIVAFSLSLVINIIFISATVISRRKTFWKQRPKADEVNFFWRSRTNTEQTATTDDPSHYQELRVSQHENTYQTLHQL